MKVSMILVLLILVVKSAIAQELYGLENSKIHTTQKAKISTSDDPDIKRALAQGLLNSRNTSYFVIEFKDENRTFWRLQVFENLEKKGPSFFVPHDSENDSFQVGAKAIKEFGGHLISLECNEGRTCQKGIDPNRYFKAKNKIFSSTIMRFFDSKNYPIITLHNNHDSHYRFGGEGAIYSDMHSPYSGGFGFYQSGDPDYLIIYSDRGEIVDSYIFKKYSNLFESLNLNSIFEEINESKKLGGHMSNYVLINTNLEYFNVEGEHGHERTQYHYLSKLLDII